MTPIEELLIILSLQCSQGIFNPITTKKTLNSTNVNPLPLVTAWI